MWWIVKRVLCMDVCWSFSSSSWCVPIHSGFSFIFISFAFRLFIFQKKKKKNNILSVVNESFMNFYDDIHTKSFIITLKVIKAPTFCSLSHLYVQIIFVWVSQEISRMWIKAQIRTNYFFPFPLIVIIKGKRKKFKCFFYIRSH